MSNQFNRMYQNARRFREEMQGYNNAFRGTDYVLRQIPPRMNQATQAMDRFRRSTNMIQAQRNFGMVESSVRRTRNELRLLGFGRTKMEMEAVHGQLYTFANMRMDTLRDQIKMTDKALKEMKSSANASQYVEEIRQAEEALASYKRELQNADPVAKMASLEGMKVAKVNGKDVIYKPYANALDQVEGRIDQFLSRGIGRMADATYQTIDKGAKAIVGATDTVAEQKQKITALAGTYQMLGQTINTMVTPYILAAGAAMALLGASTEDAMIKFQQQTLTPDVQMDKGNYRQMVREMWADTGVSKQEISATLAFNKNDGIGDDVLQDYTAQAVNIGDAWNKTGVEIARVMNGVQGKSFGGDRDITANSMAMAMKKNKGDLKAAEKDMIQYSNLYSKLAKGEKLSNEDIMGAARKNSLEEFSKDNDKLKKLTDQYKKLEDKMGTAKTKKEKSAIQQQMEDLNGQIDKAAGKNKEKMDQYTKEQVKGWDLLNGGDGSKAYDIVDNATGPIDEFMKGLRSMANALESLFAPLLPTIEKIGQAMQKVGNYLDKAFQNNPGLTSFIAHMIAGAAVVTILIGALAPLAGLLIRQRALFQALGQSIGVMGKGVAVVNPQVVMMRKNFEKFGKAILGMPRILAGAIPAMLTMIRMLPGGILKAVTTFVRLNPMLTIFAGIALLIYKNWDRVAPLFERVGEAAKLAFKPIQGLFDKFQKSGSWDKFLKAMEKIGEVLGDTLVDALEVVVPLLEAFAKILNGDFKGATESLGEAGEKFKEMFENLFKNFDFVEAFKFGKKLGEEIVKGIFSVLTDAFKKLFDFNVDAFKSGDPSKIGTAIGADILAIIGTSMLAGLVAKGGIKAVRGVLGGYNKTKNFATGTARAIGNGGRAVRNGAVGTYNVVRHPVQTVRNVGGAVRHTNVRDAYAGYRLMRDEGKGRIRSLFGGYKMAQPVNAGGEAASRAAASASEAATNAATASSRASQAAGSAAEAASRSATASGSAAEAAARSASGAGTAGEAAARAGNAASSASEAAGRASQAAGSAGEAASRAGQAAGTAGEAASNASRAAGSASEAASGASRAAGSASEAASGASRASSSASEAASRSAHAASTASEAVGNASRAAGSAAEAAASASRAASTAAEAAGTAAQSAARAGAAAESRVARYATGGAQGEAAAASRAGAGGGWGSKVLKGVGKVATPLAIGYDGWRFGQAETEEEKYKVGGDIAGGWGGALAGGAAGAAIGSAVPIIGTAIGGIAGAIIGGVGGSWAGEKVGGAMYDSKQYKKQQQAQAGQGGAPQQVQNAQLDAVINQVAAQITELGNSLTANIATLNASFMTLTTGMTTAGTAVTMLAEILTSSTSMLTTVFMQMTMGGMMTGMSLMMLGQILQSSTMMLMTIFMQITMGGMIVAMGFMMLGQVVMSSTMMLMQIFMQMTMAGMIVSMGLMMLGQIIMSSTMMLMTIFMQMTMAGMMVNQGLMMMAMIVMSSTMMLQMIFMQITMSGMMVAQGMMMLGMVVMSSAMMLQGAFTMLLSQVMASAMTMAMINASLMMLSATIMQSTMMIMQGSMMVSMGLMQYAMSLQMATMMVTSGSTMLMSAMMMATQGMMMLASSAMTGASMILGAVGGIVSGMYAAAAGFNYLAGVAMSAGSSIAGAVASVTSSAGSLASAMNGAASRISAFRMPTITTTTINVPVPAAHANGAILYANGGITPKLFADGGTIGKYMSQANNNPTKPNGGYVNQPTYVAGGRGIAGEAGPEAIIPLSVSKRSRGIELWKQVGNILGMNGDNGNGDSPKLYAMGGIVGNAMSGARRLGDVTNSIRNGINNLLRNETENTTDLGGVTDDSNTNSVLKSMASKSNNQTQQVNNSTTVQQLIGSVTINTKADINRLLDELRYKLEQEILTGGGTLNE